MIKKLSWIQFLFIAICNAASIHEKGYVIDLRCNQTTKFGLKYYVVDDNDLSKYIECGDRNWGIEQQCDEGSYFDIKLVSCMVPENSSLKIDGVIVYGNKNRRIRDVLNETNFGNASLININQTFDNSTAWKRDFENDNIDETVDMVNGSSYQNYTNDTSSVNDKRMLVDVSVLNLIPLQNATKINDTIYQLINETIYNTTQNIWKRNIDSINTTDNSSIEVVNKTISDDISIQDTTTVSMVVVERQIDDLTTNIENLVNAVLCSSNSTVYQTNNDNMTAEFKKNCTNDMTSIENATMQSSLNMPSSDNLDGSKVSRDLIDQIDNLTDLVNITLNEQKNQTNSTINDTNCTTKASVKKRSISLTTNLKSSACLCVNGICGDYTWGCICQANFTGDLCQTLVDNSYKAYSKILNGTLTAEEIVNQYNLTNINYPLMWTQVVENLWSEISPEHSFIHKHNISLNADLNSIGDSIQKLNFYSTSTLDNFPQKIIQFESVLDKLVQETNNQMKQMAVDFLKSLIKFIQEKQTINDRMMKISKEEILKNFTQETMKSQISDEFKQISMNLNQLLMSFKTGNIIDFVHSDDTSHLVQSIKNSTNQSWNMVCDYGFMYLTYKLANSTGDYYEFTEEEKLSYYNYITNLLNHHDKRSIIDSLWDKLMKAKIISKEKWSKFIEWIKNHKKN